MTSERHKNIWKRGKLCEKLSLCSNGLFVASAACLSSREAVIKVCCKTCRIKTMGGSRSGQLFLDNMLSGFMVWKGHITLLVVLNGSC